MRILSNPEIKKYNISIIALFLITIILSIFINILNLNIINKFDGYLNNNVQANSERIVYIVKKK